MRKQLIQITELNKAVEHYFDLSTTTYEDEYHFDCNIALVPFPEREVGCYYNEMNDTWVVYTVVGDDEELQHYVGEYNCYKLLVAFVDAYRTL